MTELWFHLLQLGETNETIKSQDPHAFVYKGVCAFTHNPLMSTDKEIFKGRVFLNPTDVFILSKHRRNRIDVDDILSKYYDKSIKPISSLFTNFLLASKLPYHKFLTAQGLMHPSTSVHYTSLSETDQSYVYKAPFASNQECVSLGNNEDDDIFAGVPGLDEQSCKGLHLGYIKQLRNIDVVEIKIFVNKKPSAGMHAKYTFDRAVVVYNKTVTLVTGINQGNIMFHSRPQDDPLPDEKRALIQEHLSAIKHLIANTYDAIHVFTNDKLKELKRTDATLHDILSSIIPDIPDRVVKINRFIADVTSDMVPIDRIGWALQHEIQHLDAIDEPYLRIDVILPDNKEYRQPYVLEVEPYASGKMDGIQIGMAHPDNRDNTARINFLIAHYLHYADKCKK